MKILFGLISPLHIDRTFEVVTDKECNVPKTEFSSDTSPQGVLRCFWPEVKNTALVILDLEDKSQSDTSHEH